MTSSPRLPKLPRKACLALSGILLAASGVAVIAPPASATVTTLCVGYTGCAKLGMSNAGYSTASKTMYWRMYSGHNCTNYAAYRMVRAGMANTRPWSGGGNATYWGTSMKSITNATPRVGAVAWWKAGVYPAGSAGHVAYVEKVVSATEIIVSMDSWHGDFSWARITKATKGWPSGFVHFRDAQLTSTAAPKITGTAKVGSTLATTAGSWSVGGSSYAYQWLANGTAIAGATASTLAVTNALTGKSISVRVTATQAGYASKAATSAATAVVQPGVLTNTAKPSLSGEPHVDSTLSARAGSWNPTGASLAYRWLADGQYLAGSTSPTLELSPDLVGKAIKVEVTATKTGYAAVKALSAATDPVAPGQLRASDPVLSGTAAPGSTLRLGSLDVSPSPTWQVRWERGHSTVAGATTSTYRLTAADLGHRVRAVVTLARPGYRQLVLATPYSRIVRSTPALRVATTLGHQRLALRATARAAGVPDLNGVLQVRSQGKLLRQVLVRHGAAAATVMGLPVGTRTYRFRLMTTATTMPDVVVRRLNIRK